MLKQEIESLLFISHKPLTIKKLSELSGRSSVEVETVLETLKNEYNQAEEKGIRIIFNNDLVQMATAPASVETVEKFLKEELTGEMTRPQLEALTVIAYRGPITKMELEQIRGVNCSLILRNLIMRGLVESYLDKKTKIIRYQATNDFIKFLGITETKQLPDYEKLSQHETLNELLSREENKENV
jgi:segregation and condensation protein B